MALKNKSSNCIRVLFKSIERYDLYLFEYKLKEEFLKDFEECGYFDIKINPGWECIDVYASAILDKSYLDEEIKNLINQNIPKNFKYIKYAMKNNE